MLIPGDSTSRNVQFCILFIKCDIVFIVLILTQIFDCDHLSYEEF